MHECGAVWRPHRDEMKLEIGRSGYFQPDPRDLDRLIKPVARRVGAELSNEKMRGSRDAREFDWRKHRNFIGWWSRPRYFPVETSCRYEWVWHRFNKTTCRYSEMVDRVTFRIHDSEGLTKTRRFSSAGNSMHAGIYHRSPDDCIGPRPSADKVPCF